MSHFGKTLGGLVGAGTLALMTGTAFAADLGGLKDEPLVEATPDYTIAVTGGLTTDYVFRGLSQSDNDPAVYGTVDFAYKSIYLGVFASSINFERAVPQNDPTLEIDLYGGIKKTYNGVTFDLGFIYYLYPQGDAESTLGLGDLDYIEAKFGVSGSLWTDSTLSGTVYYSPDYTLETGEVITVEGKFTQAFTLAGYSFGVSAVGGYVDYDDDFAENDPAVALLDYAYWNVGVYKTWKNFTFDVRYHDTDLQEDDLGPFFDLADERVVGTVSFAY